MSSQLPSARLRPFRPVPFGRYTLLAPLATGGMGELYLAQMNGELGFEKLCVVKKILPQLAREADFVERFVNEARVLGRLQHGSIAQVLDLGIHEGDPYLALEFVDGKDLRRVIGRMRDRGAAIPLGMVLFVMGRVLDALAYVHRKRDDDDREIGLVHRDISPQNVLVSYEGQVKVIDFGLAKSALSASQTNPSIILGKFLYMSPEQARQQRVDRRSDIYSVGLCLYELISGSNPFEGCPPAELMARVSSPQISPLRSANRAVPASVDELVMKALAVDPGQRFESAEAFRTRLLACQLEVDPGAGPESVSRFMREAFAPEHQQERKLFASLRTRPRTVAVEQPPEAQAETGVYSARDGSPVPPEPPTRVAPIQAAALSFAPTPRTGPPEAPARRERPSRPSAVEPSALRERETQPGVPIEVRPASPRPVNILPFEVTEPEPPASLDTQASLSALFPAPAREEPEPSATESITTSELPFPGPVAHWVASVRGRAWILALAGLAVALATASYFAVRMLWPSEPDAPVAKDPPAASSSAGDPPSGEARPARAEAVQWTR